MNTNLLEPDRYELDKLLKHYQDSEFVEAEKLALAITKKFPNHSFSWKVLGSIYEKTEKKSKALIAKQKAIEINPKDAEAYCNLGNTFNDLARYNEAEESFREAIKLKPDFAEAFNNLGNVLQSLSKYEEAEDIYYKAINLNPDFIDVYYNLANNFEKLKKFKEAIIYYRQVIKMNPNFAEAYNNLGNILRNFDKQKEAEDCFRKAINLKDTFFEAYNNLAILLHDTGKLEKAEKNYKKAIKLNPDIFMTYNNLARNLYELGKIKEAESILKNIIKREPNLISQRSNLLFLQSVANIDSYIHVEEAKKYGEIIKNNSDLMFERWSCDNESKALKVGFVSADLKNHPVGFFLEGLLKEIDQSSIKLYAYSLSNHTDDLTERIKNQFVSWVNLHDKNDDDAAKIIHNDGLHILIDLMGHTKNNRLTIFSRKPAPIQATWLGYWATTGVKEIDYIIGDPYRTPFEEAHHFTEMIYQLPESSICFSEPTNKIEVKELPAIKNGYITLGCFNNLNKMNEDNIKVRAEILKSINGSKLFLKNKQLDNFSRKKEVLKRYAKHGINSDRLILEGSSPRGQYLESYNRIDIAISPFPYGGVTTSLEGLWMGVPVINKKGNCFISHVGEAICHNIGFPDWIAENEEDYVLKVVNLASDLEKLNSIRLGLRKEVTESALFDTKKFAQHFQEALWQIWRN